MATRHSLRLKRTPLKLKAPPPTVASDVAVTQLLAPFKANTVTEAMATLHRFSKPVLARMYKVMYGKEAPKWKGERGSWLRVEVAKAMVKRAYEVQESEKRNVESTGSSIPVGKGRRSRGRAPVAVAMLASTKAVRGRQPR